LATLLTVAALFLLVFPLIQGRELGWPIWSYIMLLSSIPVMLAFIRWQKIKYQRDGSPLVLLSLFQSRSFSVGLILNIIFEASMIGFFLIFSLLLQIGLGFSPIHAALTGLPTAVGIALTMATMGQKVIPKLGRSSFNIGAVLMGLGLAYTSYIFSHYGLQLHSWQLIVGLLAFGVGMGFVFATLFAAVLNDVDSRHAGSASGILNAVQQVGAAVGIAVVGVIFFGQLSHAAPASYQKVEPQFKAQLSALHLNSAQQKQISAGVETCYIARAKEKDTSITPASCKQNNATSQTGKISALSEATAKQANAKNFDNAYKWGIVYTVCLLTFAFFVTYLLPRRFKSSAYAEI
jgi:hypothetical protein